uniref:Galactosylgalactosylxylosylprotein 3-beta-glucuronosyltransferase n=1 Tax=Glossina austeni TaxID=7395 RepID=A0A1A9ULU4_GLOAU
MAFKRKKKYGRPKIIGRRCNVVNMDCMDNHIYYHALNPRLTWHSKRLDRSPWLKTEMGRRSLVGIMILIAMILCVSWWIIAGFLSDGRSDFVKHYAKKKNGFKKIDFKVCEENFQDKRSYIEDKRQEDWNDLPIIYFITSTYPWREQMPKLLKLGYTLQHVPRLHWIVTDFYPTCNQYLSAFLYKFHIPFTHLSNHLLDGVYEDFDKFEPQGFEEKEAGIEWLRTHNITSGILYFGNDDNAYDLKLFQEIRSTRLVSMFPVGRTMDANGISGPLVREGKIVGFLTPRENGRRWPVDMAGFALNLSYMPKYLNAGTMPDYEEEDYLLRCLALNMDVIEPKGNNCTEILAWRTRSRRHRDSLFIRSDYEYLDNRTNLGSLFKSLHEMGIVELSDHKGIQIMVGENGEASPLSHLLD